MSASKAEQRARTFAVLESRRPPSAPFPKNVYGICLSEDCLKRFGIMICKRMHPTFDETDETQVLVSKFFAIDRIPGLCILGVPDLWLSRWALPFARSDAGVQQVLVLADDGSEENKALALKNSKQVVAKLLRFLGMEEQEPRWYPVQLARVM